MLLEQLVVRLKLSTMVSGCELLHRDAISAVFREPYILTRYRKPNNSYLECLKYIFVLHNDVINFWTHFIPLWLWLGWLSALSFSIDFYDPYWHPLLVLWIGGCVYALCSSIAHGLACKSLLVRQFVFMLDYVGISIYTFAAGLAYYYYQRPVGYADWLFSYKKTFISISVIFTINSSILCSLTRFFCVKKRYIFRILSFIGPYILGITPFNLRMISCYQTGTEEECVWYTMPFHFVGVIASVLMVFFFISKIPERYSPGTFDIFCQSHQLFHISAATITTIQFYVIPIDAQVRRQSLTGKGLLVLDSYSTLFAMFIVITAGLLIVCTMTILVNNKILTSNKLNGKPNKQN